MELVYLCPAVKKAVGGVKVIYRQAELVDRILHPTGGSAAILHPNTLRFRVKWFDAEVRQKRAFFHYRWVGKPSLSGIRGVFAPASQMVVVPELWVRKYGVQLLEAGVPYAIYVQNGYYIDKGREADLTRAYQGARCILTVSEDCSRCVAMAFPGVEARILRVHCSVDASHFNPAGEKENLITYMPRKLPDHSSKVLFFLRHHLPAHWRVMPIDGLNEQGVAQLLARSKIFLSFSHMEGFGLPPVEAAMSGNHVIGYTGQGGKEYWNPAVFDEVESGDLVGFAQRVLERVRRIDSGDQVRPDPSAIAALGATYSPQQEWDDMHTFLRRMQAI